MAYVSLTSLSQRAMKWVIVEADPPSTSSLVCSVQTAAASSAGAQEATRLVLSPGTLAGPGAVWSPVAVWWQGGSQSAAGPETGQAAQDWPVSSADCFPAPAANFSLLVL